MVNFEIIGIDGRDKRVYEALLLNPRASVRGIAETTGINRGSVHESLKKLSSVGLVTFFKKGATIRYTAESPEKLHEIVNEKRRRLLDVHDEVDSYIKELPLENPAASIFHFAAFYDGDEGMANILRDVLSTCRLQKVQEYRVISSPRVAEYLYNNFKNYTRERIKQNLSVKVLRQGRGSQRNGELSEWQILEGRSDDSGCYTIIYGTKVAIVSIDAANHTSGIIIDNSGVSATQESLFNLSWR